MGEIQTYPEGIPAAGDLVPYVADPAGTPALKLVDVATFGSSGGGAAIDTDDTNTLIVTGTTETVVRTVTRPASAAVAIATMRVSMLEVGVYKSGTVRVRRDDTAGAILWHTELTFGADSSSGDTQYVTGFAMDEAPTGTWVLTVQATTGSPGTQVWSASSGLAVIG